MKLVFSAALMLLPVSAMAVLSYEFTDAEVAAMPPLCQEKIKGGSQRFANQFGMHSWGQMHHYCHGVKFVMRARRYPNDRPFYLTSARGEFQYVVRAITENHWFRPQLYLELAQVHVQLGEHSDAQALLLKAISLNRNYEPAYVALSALQRDMGVKNLALETATEGLRYIPESKRLQKAYLDNGGRMPFPHPAVETVPSAEVAPDEKVDDQPATVAAEAGNGEASAGTLEGVPESGCRFCPPQDIQQRWREWFHTE